MSKNAFKDLGPQKIKDVKEDNLGPVFDVEPRCGTQRNQKITDIKSHILNKVSTSSPRNISNELS